jgi:beta-N-acetylhexosaminidase
MRSKRAVPALLPPIIAGAALTAALCGAGSPFAPRWSAEASTRLSSLDLEEKAAQVLLIGAEGRGRPSADSLALLERMPVGGVLLLGSNLTDEPAEAGRFTAALQGAALRCRPNNPIPLIVAIDHEGGSVFRFKGEGITRIPPAAEVGKRGRKLADFLGRAAGSELHALGINMALAPVVELVNERNEAFLGTRSYGSSAREADAAAGAYLEGLQAERVAAVAKHFPGNAGEDPHEVLPSLELSSAEYRRDYAPRFASAIRRRVSAVMLSHVVFAVLDPERPASLSPVVVERELRGRLGFRGLVLTDDVGMRALSATRSYEETAVEALAAGADLVMLLDMRAAPRVRDAIVRAVEGGRLPASRLDEAALGVLELKARFGMDAALDERGREEALAGFDGLVREHAERLRSFR